MANEETGFFRFDTNADAVAADIAEAMRRIQGSVSGMSLDPGAIGRDTAEMGQMFSRLENDLNASRGRVNKLLQDYASGAIGTKEEFQTRFRDEVRTSVAGVPQIFADEMALMPETTASRMDVGKVAKQVVQDYYTEARNEVKRQTGNFQGLRADEMLGGRGDFKGAIAGAQTPAFGRETSRMQQLINQIRGEKVLAQNPSPDLPYSGPAHMREYVDHLRELADAQGRLSFNEKSDQFSLVPSTAVKELNEVVRAEREAEATAIRLGKAYERTAQQAREMAAAQELLGQATTKLPRGYYGTEGGDVVKPTGEGRAAMSEAEAKQALADLNQQKANYQRMADSYLHDDATRIGSSTYVTGSRQAGAEVYQKTGEGTAKRLTDEVDIENALRAQERLLGNVAKGEELAARNAQRRAATQEGNSGLLGGLLTRLNRGEGGIMSTIGTQIGSAALFTAAYGSIFALIGALKDIEAEFLDYQDSLTDLQVAMKDDDAVTQGYVNTLSDLSRVTGSNVGESMDTAARGVRAFGGAVSGTRDEVVQQMQDIGEATNAAATKLSLIADKSLPDATGDLVAAGTAFGLQPDQLNQVVDAVANAKRNVGGDAGQISQGLALIANAAQEAGFTLNQAAAVIGLVQARTDESGQAIATRLTRVFQIVSGSTGKGLAREFQSQGVDPNSSVREQLESYASIYSDPSTSVGQRNRISSALGGTANLRELLPLLKEQGTLTEAYKDALDHAGQGTTEFQRKTQNLVGTLKQIQGDIKAIETNAAISGIFDPFAAAVKTAEPLLHLLDRMLQTWDKMPQGIRTALGLTLDFLVASKALAVVQGRRAAVREARELPPLPPTAGTAAPVARAALATATTERVAAEVELNAARAAEFAARNKEAAEISIAAERRAAAELRYTEAVVGATAARAEVEALSTRSRVLGTIAGDGAGALAGTRAGAAGLLGFATNPYVLTGVAAVAGLISVNKFLDANEQKSNFGKAFAGAQSTFGRINPSGDLSTNITDLRSAAGNLEKSSANFASKLTRDTYAKKLNDQADALEGINNRVTTERYAMGTGTDVFGGPITSVDQLTKGLDALATNGASAASQFRLLARALDSTKTAADPQVYRPERYAANFLNINEVLKASLPKEIKVQERRQAATASGSSVPVVETNTYSRNEFLEKYALTGKELDKFDLGIQKFMESRGHKSGDKYTAEDVKATVDYVQKNLPQFGDIVGGTSEIRKKFIKNMLDAVGNMTGQGEENLLSGKGPIGNSDLLTLLYGNEDKSFNGVVARLDASLQEVPASDDGRIKQARLKGGIEQIKNQIARAKKTGEDTPSSVLVTLQGYESQLAEVTISRLEKLRAVAAGSTNTSAAQAAKRDEALVKREIAAAIKAGDANQLAQVIANAGAGAIALARQAIQNALKVAKAAREADYTSAYNALRGPSGVGGDGKGLNPDDANKPSALEKRLRGLLKSLKYDTEADSPQQIGAARAQYVAAQQGGGQLANAGAAVAQAQADLHAAKEGSVAWYNAQAALTNAQRDYQTALGAVGPAKMAASAARLGGGLAPARAQIAAARAQLQTSEKGTVEWYQALESLYGAQQSYSSALVQYRNNLDQLHGDITDPVENARDALRAAQRQLRADRGMGKDVRAQDKVAAEQAQASLESAKFSQRLSDAQTAEQLGKMSHAAYIKYLTNEHDRLTSIKHKSRQQIDELNEIDTALKSAKDEMDGQFNLGDINTNGLVYQVRRQAAEARAYSATSARTALPAQTNQTVSIAINGADVAKVKSILRDYLRVPTAQRRTLAKRRV